MTAKDLFIIHSKREPFEETLVARIVEWLDSLAISFYEYGDWTWSRREHGQPRYSSASGKLDPIRFAMGHPEPYKRATWQERPDRHALGEMLDSCRIALIIGPRGGSPSEGVGVELQVLPYGPARIVASWGDQNDWIVRDQRPGFVYRMTDTFDREQAKTALDLAHLVWLHRFLDTLARDCQSAGRVLLQQLCAQDAVIHRVATFAGWVSIDPGAARTDPLASASDPHLDPRRIADLVPAGEAGTLVRQWFGSGRLHATLPPSSNPEVTAPVSRLVEACNAFCEAVLARHPALADEKADGLCLAAAVVAALGDRDTALRMFEEALAEMGLGATARSRVLAQRASALARWSPLEAEADIAEVLRSGVAANGARVQALWLRARISKRRHNVEAAVADLDAALQIRADEPALRALCLHDRSTCHGEIGHMSEAIEDLDELLHMPHLHPAISGPARLDRAVLRGQVGQVDGELADYGATIELEGVPDEIRLKAHMYRALTYVDQGSRHAAIADLVTVRDDPASSDDARSAATAKLDELDPFK
jgi:hypothetical protein